MNIVYIVGIVMAFFLYCVWNCGRFRYVDTSIQLQY